MITETQTVNFISYHLHHFGDRSVKFGAVKFVDSFKSPWSSVPPSPCPL